MADRANWDLKAHLSGDPYFGFILTGEGVVISTIPFAFVHWVRDSPAQRNIDIL
ncbi:hypothetical protein [Xenorhabdus bovienii]|uniref:hypothetical protein n=1 Tax=Xenorhabdus bovienii TaxID=40576 RepID=UPI0012D2FEF6|nr:hypothetical protein [Xenorhabdus bovienii]